MRNRFFATILAVLVVVTLGSLVLHAMFLRQESLTLIDQQVQLSFNGQFIRVLNLKLPRFPDRTLQVGVVFDENLINPNYFSKSSILFFSVIVVLGFVASFF